jgi:hypothetical protein
LAHDSVSQLHNNPSQAWLKFVAKDPFFMLPIRNSAAEYDSDPASMRNTSLMFTFTINREQFSLNPVRKTEAGE